MLGAARGVRRGEPGRDDDAVHPRRGDEPGDGRRRCCAQTLAESLAGMAYVQLVRAGRAGRVRLVRVVDVDAVRRADVRDARAGARPLRHGGARPAARRAVPLGRRASRASKVADAQAAYESANTMQPTMLGGVNFVLHAAGWLEGGLSMGYEKFVLDDDQLGMWHAFARGRRPVRERPGDGRVPDERAGHALPRASAHARELRAGLLPLADRRTTPASSSGRARARRTRRTRANAIWKRTLAEYEPPPIDDAVDEELREWIERKKASFPDSNV